MGNYFFVQWFASLKDLIDYTHTHTHTDTHTHTHTHMHARMHAHTHTHAPLFAKCLYFVLITFCQAALEFAFYYTLHPPRASINAQMCINADVHL